MIHPNSDVGKLSTIDRRANEGRPVSKQIQSQLWDALHEHIRSQHQRQLLHYVDATIEHYYPCYCASDGRVIDRRLARRVGISPGTLSRLRGVGEGSMTRLSHFLAMMYLCGISWEDVGFPSPQQAVLESIADVFPIAQNLVGTEVVPQPSHEEILLLYFLTSTPRWNEIYRERQMAPGIFDDCCNEAIAAVRNYEIDAEQQPMRLIPEPKINTSDGADFVYRRYETVWTVLRDTFPFLGKPDAQGNSWGLF